jgi:probable DNA metabolism protein
MEADIAYLYDGSLAGFFCCVYASVYQRQLPYAITPEYEAAPSLLPQKRIMTSAEQAYRVQASLPAKIGNGALSLVETVFLSCMPEKELALLKFLLRGYREGSRLMQLLGDPLMASLFQAEAAVGKEAHLLKGFIRFSDYDGVLAASISPKNFVLPFLERHFINRFSGEDFLIYDRTHRVALIYRARRSEIVAVDKLDFPVAGEEEERYRTLWKQFYHTIAIESRYNPRCRMTQLPKRYWENMTEMQDLL